MEFARKLESFPGYASYLDELRKTDVEIDQWQLEKLAMVGLKHELFFYTPGVSKAQLGSLGAQTFDNLHEATATLLDGLSASAHILLVPDGPYTYARAI
jgi:hypothetical protein